MVAADEAKERRGSVLFLLGVWGVGGVERVTVTLANVLAARGWRVTIVAFRFDDRALLEGLAPEAMVKALAFPAATAENAKALRVLFLAREVGVVVNQWGLPWGVTRLLRRAGRGLGVGLVSVLHNIPDNNGRIAAATGLRRWLWRLLSGLSLRLVYGQSDAFVVLSKRFEPIFRRMTGLAFTPRLRTIGNPLTLAPAPAPKEDVLLYVGRLEETQKRVSRVLGAWRLLAPRFPGWRLEIVGDGPDRAALEAQAQGLPRVAFHGFRDPAPFYAKARLLLLTSDFEGFPLVLPEAMAAGCVPVALGTYPAVYDVVRGTNGVVVAPPFEAEGFARVVGDLMAAPAVLDGMAGVAQSDARAYTLDAVADRWEALFKEVSRG